jgi:hypothetical protein
MLPTPPELERICKGIAALDATLSDDWEYRYYSFDARWAKGQRLASMRNGEGDDWFIVFTRGLVFVKSFWHEHARGDPKKIYADLPAALKPQLKEAAFEMDLVTFGGFHDGKKWTLRGNAKPMKAELAILSGDPKQYRKYAKHYFERDVPLERVARALAGKPLDTKQSSQLRADLKEIGYGEEIR